MKQPSQLRLAMAQINVVVGDIEGNANKIIDWIDRARDASADVVTFPELAFVAITRGLAGAGVGLLLADFVAPAARKPLGWSLLAIGALTTVPIAATLLTRRGD